MNDRTPEFSKGATAALQALRQLSSLLQEHKFGESDSDYRARDAHLVQLMIEAAGPVSPHAAGFIAACAEYLVFSEDCGLQEIEVWVPDATLSDAEIQQRRADLRFPPAMPNNVIPLRHIGPPRP